MFPSEQLIKKTAKVRPFPEEGKGTDFLCNPKTMGYAHGSEKAEADE